MTENERLTEREGDREEIIENKRKKEIMG